MFHQELIQLIPSLQLFPITVKIIISIIVVSCLLFTLQIKDWLGGISTNGTQATEIEGDDNLKPIIEDLLDDLALSRLAQ